MHPALRTPKQFFMMGLLWSPIMLWVVSLLVILVDVPWLEAVIWSVPPMLLELFLCLSLWYLCRILVLDRLGLAKSIWTHLVAAVLVNGLWLLLLMLWSEVMEWFFKTGLWQSRFLQALPVFIAVSFSLYFIAVLTHYLVLANEKNRLAEQELLKQTILAGQAELKALKATVHPHFLFNCLNLLNPLMASSQHKAQTLVSQLSDFLLYSLRYGKKEKVSVREELEHVQNYLGIESIRLGERLKVEYIIDEAALECRMLPLTLLPLVENAIKHGISQCLDGGLLSLIISKTEPGIRLTVVNPWDEPTQKIRGEGMGLTTLKKRIHTFYGNDGWLNSWKKDGIFKVEIGFPVT